MRFTKFKRITTLLAILAGLALLAVSLFAYQLGLDNNPEPGRLRKWMALAGVLLALSPLLLYLLARLDRHIRVFSRLLDALRRLGQRIHQRFPERAEKTNFFNSNAVFWCLLGVVIFVFISFWYITNGRFHFHFYSDYYDHEADAFLAGQVYLKDVPPQELETLADPYDWRQRTGFGYMWDASYYNGKYYLYWGPIPALLAALVKLVKPGVVEDQYLLSFFMVGLVGVMSAFFYRLRRKYFPGVPAWTLTLFTLLGGLSTPMFWLVNRPNVYETSIASCQFFMILGIYAVFRGLDGSRRSWPWMLLAGIALGAAVGSRTSIAFAIAFIVAATLWILLQRWRKDKSTLPALIALVTPLVLMGCAWMWFNYVRFGSLFETGMRYQLTGDALPDDFSQLFALRYIIPNLYLSLLQPYQFTPREFPFFIATIDVSWTKILGMPRNYFYTEQITGILCSIPFLWLLIVPLIEWLKKGWRWVKEIPGERDADGTDYPPKWLWALLAGAFLIAFTTNMLFVMTTMRYLADFLPLLLILAVMLVMRSIERMHASRVGRSVFLSALAIFCLATFVISLFINFTCGDRRMLNENPNLYFQLVQFFTK